MRISDWSSDVCSSDLKAVWGLQQRITAAIRAVDKKHVVIVEGNCWGNNYQGLPPAWDANMVLSFHKYWNRNDAASIADMVKLRDSYGRPIWLGEWIGKAACGERV